MRSHDRLAPHAGAARFMRWAGAVTKNGCRKIIHWLQSDDRDPLRGRDCSRHDWRRAAVPHLAFLVHDEDAEVQEVVIEALAEIGGPEARGVLSVRSERRPARPGSCARSPGGHGACRLWRGRRFRRLLGCLRIRHTRAQVPQAVREGSRLVPRASRRLRVEDLVSGRWNRLSANEEGPESCWWSPGGRALGTA